MEGAWPAEPALLRQPVLIVRQEWRARLRPPDYDVFDRGWDLLATARYVSKDDVRSLLAPFGLSHRTAAALRVSDTSGSTVLTAVFPGFRGRAVMLVHDADGRHIGSAVKTEGYLKVRYDLTSSGRPVGVVQAMDRRQRLVRVTDHTGEPVAAVRTGYEGAPFPVPEKKDGYWLERLRPMPEPLRSLVVASTVALQAAIGSESRTGETVVLRMSLIPPMLDRLRRRPPS